jgi:hypothetical protein
MSEAPASSSPVAWICLAVLQRAVYTDTLYTGLSIIAVVTKRCRDRRDMSSVRNLNVLSNASIMRRGKTHTTYGRMFHLRCIGTACKLPASETRIREPVHADSVANLDW